MSEQKSHADQGPAAAPEVATPEVAAPEVATPEAATPEAVREAVSAAYTRAVSTPAPAAGCCCGAESKGVAAALAGYDRNELADLPEAAVVNSFGCGNPLAFSGVQPGDVVLDLGSGAGIDLLLAARKVGPQGHVIGVDMTDAMIEKARANIAAAGLTNVEVRKGLIEALPVADRSVDWVISNCVINLSPQKERVFAEIARVLKPGGQMLVSDIVVRDLPGWVRDIAALYSSCVTGAISEEDYLAGLRAAGLEQVAVRDRVVYDQSNLTGLVESELPTDGGGCCGAGNASPELIRKVAAALAGRVWSAQIYARKPAAPAGGPG